MLPLMYRSFVASAKATVSVGALHPGLQFIYLPYRVSGSTHTAVGRCWTDGPAITPGFYPGSNEQHRLF